MNLNRKYVNLHVLQGRASQIIFCEARSNPQLIQCVSRGLIQFVARLIAWGLLYKDKM